MIEAAGLGMLNKNMLHFLPLGGQPTGRYPETNAAATSGGKGWQG